MPTSPSLAGRAAFAAALMIGFYALALGIAGFLFWMPYYEWSAAKTVHPKLVVMAVLGGGAILWAICPRIDRFEAPGPRIDRTAQPELFAAIDEVAAATGQDAPSEVYFVNDVNAWVTERGGVMGFGSRRVMGLGLPLMQLLTVSEFKGVLAHEFGHYHGGDTKLGPWIYKTRGAIVRSVQNLESSLLQKPFVWYGNMFLRMTHGVSRSQEYAADALASSVVGKTAMATGLRAIHAAGSEFEVYWQTEAVPVLTSGYRPPLAAGFARFLGSSDSRARIAEQLVHATAKASANPYDTHPSLSERTAAIEALPNPMRTLARDDRPAISLMRDLPTVEFAMLATIAGDSNARNLKQVDWDRVAEIVYLPNWRSRCSAQAELLRGARVADLPRRASLKAPLIARARQAMREGHDYDPTLDAALAELDTLGAAVAIALHERGHRAECAPGAPIVFRNRDETASHATLEPFESVRALSENKMGAGDWKSTCEAFGIHEVLLG